jgi:hypothetical protein
MISIHTSNIYSSNPLNYYPVDNKRKMEEVNNNQLEYSDKKFKTEYDSDSQEELQEIIGETKYVTLNEFEEEFLQIIPEQLEFTERMEALKSYLSPQENEHYDLYIILNEKKELEIKIELKEKKFRSLSLVEAVNKETYFEKQNYYYISVYETIPVGSSFVDVKVLKIRTSFLGSKGELEWIQKGDRLSGNAVLSLYGMIEKIIKVKEMVLYDDSKLIVEDLKAKKSQKKVNVSLRTLRALSSTDEKGLSWYEEKGGFTPLTCQEYPTKWEKLTQNPENYRDAIKLVRNTTLETVLRTHQTFPNSVKTINRLAKKYLSNDKNQTIHDLVRTMNEAAKTQNSTILYDIGIFFNQVISVFISDGKADDQFFFNSLRILEKTRMFVKNEIPNSFREAMLSI